MTEKRWVYFGVVLAVTALVAPASAGDGLVALQNADASCRSTTAPPPRYVDCDNGTVTDNDTGLVWLKNANCMGPVDWYTAMEFVAGLSDKPAESAAANQDCGLSDGSSPGEWRLPSVEEWEAMIANALGQGGDPDCTASPPTITNDSGLGCWVSGPSSFTGVESSVYWASTTCVNCAAGAWSAYLVLGIVDIHGKSNHFDYVWPVRGGQ
ncbi:MAG: DUF1566 domain-containing protein [Acidimicrobiia bacterium]|nr:DUF1566 domain-containing protein [Acidimicrobiia bacterium]